MLSPHQSYMPDPCLFILHAHTHTHTHTPSSSSHSVSSPSHMNKHTQMHKIPLCRVPLITYTQAHTQVISHIGCLFLSLSLSHTHTHTHTDTHTHYYLLPSPHLSQIFFLALQLISLASFALPCSSPPVRRFAAWLCPHAQSQMHTIHSPSFPASHPQQPSVG